jgi:hypothetical protein
LSIQKLDYSFKKFLMLAKLNLRWPLLILLIMAILSLFWPAILHPTHIVFPTFSAFSDLMVIHWPKAHLMAQSWQAGEGLPHWTPLILSGMPLAANQLAMLSYPPAWLFFVLPPEPVFNLLFIFHLLLGGFGVYFLLHQGHDLSPAAALLGGLTFALNGKYLAHIAGGHVSMAGAIGWLPWALFGLMMLLKQQGGRGTGEWGSNPFYSGWILVIAVALAMQMVTHTLLLIYTVYLLAAALVWHFGFNRNSTFTTEIKRLWLPLLSIPILAGLLGATQLLPLVELTQFSNRSLSLSQAAEFAVSPLQLILGLLLPSAQGGHELVIYLGLVPLLLAPFGLTRNKRWTWFYGALFLFTVLFALGPSTPVHSLFYHFVPGFRWVRTPARFFFVGAVAIAALVGFGLDRLRQPRWPPAAKRWLTRLTVALGGLALMIGLGLAFGFGQMSRATLALAIFIPLGLSLVLLRVRRIISSPRAIILLGMLLFLDLASFDRSMIRFVSPPEALAPGQAAAEYLAQKSDLFRVYSPSYSLPMQSAAVAGLHLADGVEPVHLAIYDRYMARAGGYDDASFSVTIPNFGDGPLESALRETQPNLKLLGLLNVAYLASAFPMRWPGLTLETDLDGTFIYRNEYALPRAWVAHQAIPAEADWLAQLESLAEDGSVILVEDTIDTIQPSALGAQRSTALITHYAADLTEIKTEIEQPGWLTLSEIWYPGWQASVNDSPQPVERVNGLLRGVYLSQSGQYRVRLEYRPNSVVWGNWISGITVLVVILGRGRQLLRIRQR